MREDFDYVSMESYTEDTTELAGIASAALRSLRGENEDLHRLVWALVYSAGCTVKVDPHLLMDAKFNPKGCVLNTWRDEVDNTIAFKAVRTTDEM